MEKITKTNFADISEKIMREYFNKNKRNIITTSQIRNILSKISNLGEKSKGKNGDLTDDELAEIQYIKMRIAYDSGRERKVKTFVEHTNLFEQINEIGKDREKLSIFYNYFESLVAYHRFLGGRD